MMLALLACAGPPEDTAATPADPATVLVEVAQAFDAHIYVALYYAIGIHTIFDMADGDVLTGTTRFPEEASPDVALPDGALTFAWTVTNRVEPDAPDVRYWDWAIDVAIDRLALPSASVAGEATWTLTHEEYDYAFQHHAWEGRLAIDGAPPVDAAWTGWGSWGALNAMEGTIDGAAVAWENEEPDLP